MASVARAIEQAASQKVDASLWWESHCAFLQDLEKCLAPDSGASSFRALPSAQNLAEEFQVRHTWLLEMLTLFKPPSVSSREALKFSRISIGNNVVDIQPELCDTTLEISSHLDLDEVQTYLLLSRCIKVRPNFMLEDDPLLQVTMSYYMERQCLLKCTRLLLTSQMLEEEALPSSHAEVASKEVKMLLESGIEEKTIANLKKLFPVMHVDHLAQEYTDMWVEEIIMEQSLLMDILFLLYYEPLCICSSGRWKELLLMFQEMIFESRSVEMLVITIEVKAYAQHVRHQAMLILVEALDLDNVLLMIHADIAFSSGKHGFSLEELHKLDHIIAGLDPVDAAEYAPLLLGWASFLCLVSSLPSDGIHADTLDCEHAGYAHQAHKSGAYEFLLHMLQTDLFREPDAPISGYKSVVKTLIAACLAAYDFSDQTERCNLLADILCHIYRGQEALCYELWDRESVLDGPIRNLLFSLRERFPYQILSLIRLLSSLCEGSWPAECVYNFLFSMVEVTSLIENYQQPSGPGLRNLVKTTRTLQIPDAPGLLIPAGTLGRIISVLDNSMFLVNWKYNHNALMILLVRLLQWPLSDYIKEEIYAIIDLFNHMLKSNKMLAPLILDIDISKAILTSCTTETIKKSQRFDIICIVCSLINNFVSNRQHDAATSNCIDILGSLSIFYPVDVASGVSTTDLFLPTNKYSIVSDDRSSLRQPVQSKILANLHKTGRYSLIVSVIDLGKGLLERGIFSESMLSLIMQTIQKVLLDYLNWKYKERHDRWEAATKILEFLLSVLGQMSWNNDHLQKMVLDALLNDAAIHDVLLHVIIMDDRSLEELHFNRSVQPKEIEWMEQAICTVLKLLDIVLLEVNAKECPIMSLLEQSLFQKPKSSMPFVAVVMSFICYVRNVNLQAASVKLLKNMCVAAHKAQPHSFNIASYISTELKMRLRTSISHLLSDECALRNCNLFEEVLYFLHSAVRFQPALVELLLFPWEYNEDQKALLEKAVSVDMQVVVAKMPCSPLKKSECLDVFQKILRQCEIYMKSNPFVLSRVLFFLSSLWQGGTEYAPLIEAFKHEDKFWECIGSCLPTFPASSHIPVESTPAALQMQEVVTITTDIRQKSAKAMQYHCQASIFCIIANDLFLHQQSFYLGINDSNLKVASVEANKNYASIGQDTKIGTSDLGKGENSDSLLVLIRWIQSSKVQQIVQSVVFHKAEKEVLSEAKAEAQALVVGLMGKVLAGDTRGMNLSFVHRLREASSKVLEHSAFMELFSHYSSHGFGHGGEQVHTMLLSDLYHHLHGQVRGGRQVPIGPFQQIANFLVSIELDRLLLPESHLKPKALHPVQGNTFIYDISALEHALGLDLWPKDDGEFLPVSTVKTTLQSLSRANMIASLEDAKLCALGALSDLLAIAMFDKQTEFRKALDAAWTRSNLQGCVLDLCDTLKMEIVDMGPLKYEDNYLSKFVFHHAQLLLMLFQWLGNHAHGADLWKVCAKIVRTSVVCLRHALETIEHFQEKNVLVKSLLTTFLFALELMYTGKHENDSSSQELGEAFVDVTLAGLELLPLLCSAVHVKVHASLSLAAINILIKGFLASSTWLPIVYEHFPTKQVISRLSVLDIDSCSAVLQLCLTFSRVKKSAELLSSAGFIDHFLIFTQQLKEESSFNVNDTTTGPFSIWHKKPRQQGLWLLGVTVVTAMVHVLAENQGDKSVVDNAFRFFRTESYRILGALRTPYPTNDTDGKKRVRLQNPQTSLAGLQESQYVIALLCELVQHHLLWKNALQDSSSTIREMAIHLLAYIAREGLARSSSSTAGLNLIVICPPQNKDEFVSQSKPLLVGSCSAWFAVAARGSGSNSKKVIPKSSFQGSSSSPLQKTSSFSNAVVVLNKSRDDFSVAYSEYSDKIALRVYTISSLLLTFICEEVHQAIGEVGEGQIPDLSQFPELPAPEILHGLQDQVLTVLTEVCSMGRDKMAKEIQQVCCLLLGILEKSLYLEACLIRLCGIAPLSLRLDDFSREYKAFLIAAQNFEFMETVLATVKQIVSLAYPGVA